MRKTKPSEAELAFHTYARSDADAKNSEISAASYFLPSLVSKLDSSEKDEVRLSAIRSLIESFTKHCAHARDDRMSDVALANLREIIVNKESKNLHNESLRLICALSVGRRSDFSSRAQLIIKDILASIGYPSSEYEAYRAFAISFLVANSIEGREESLDIYKAFLDAFINSTTTTVKTTKNHNKAKSQNKSKGNTQSVNTNNGDEIKKDADNDKKAEDITDNIEKSDTNSENNNNSQIQNSIDNNTNTANLNSDILSINNEKDNKNEILNSNEANNENENNKIEQTNQEKNEASNDDDNDNVTDNSNEKVAEEQNTSTENQNQSNQSNPPENDQQMQTKADNPQQTPEIPTFSLKKRGKYRGNSQALREIIQGTTLIASSLPSEASAEDFIDELTTVINICIGSDGEKDSSNIDPLLAGDALDLFLVVYECILERHEELHISQSDEQSSSMILKARDFISHFRPNIETLINRANFSGGNKGKNKTKEKSLRQKIAFVLRCVDGCSKQTMDLAFNEQRVSIEGARKVFLAEAVKRVTQKNFLSHLQANPALQKELGFSLVSNQNAIKLKKLYKTDIKQDRVLSKKEREMDRMKKRKMKETRNQDFND